MSSGLTESITIQSDKALASEWEGQLLKLTMRKRLLEKYSANEIAQIHEKYAPQKEAIRNKISDLGRDNITSEYTELMNELRELENMESDEVKAIEENTNNMEGEIDLEKANLESRLEAVKSDIESLEEMRKENVEDSFGYFQT